MEIVMTVDLLLNSSLFLGPTEIGSVKPSCSLMDDPGESEYLPTGSEVLFSMLTIPHIVVIQPCRYADMQGSLTSCSGECQIGVLCIQDIRYRERILHYVHLY